MSASGNACSQSVVAALSFSAVTEVIISSVIVDNLAGGCVLLNSTGST